MAISYNGLWKILIDKGMKKGDLKRRTGISSGTIAKMCNFARYTSDASRYAKFFAQAFDFATIPFYPRTTVPERDRYDYSYVDHALSFLLDKGITPKGPPLWFGHQDVNPKWLFGLPYPELRREAANIARHHAFGVSLSITL